MARSAILSRPPAILMVNCPEGKEKVACQVVPTLGQKLAPQNETLVGGRDDLPPASGPLQGHLPPGGRLMMAGGETP